MIVDSQHDFDGFASRPSLRRQGVAQELPIRVHIRLRLSNYYIDPGKMEQFDSKILPNVNFNR